MKKYTWANSRDDVWENDMFNSVEESWSAYNTTEKGKLEELREELALVIMEWFKKNDNEPNLYYINGFVTRSIT